MNRQERRNRKRSLRRQAEVDPHSAVVPPGYVHVDRLNESQLHQRLVSDAVQGVATPLAWAVAAYERIGRLSGRGADDAYQSVRDEFKVLTGGHLGMPLA